MDDDQLKRWQQRRAFRRAARAMARSAMALSILGQQVKAAAGKILALGEAFERVRRDGQSPGFVMAGIEVNRMMTLRGSELVRPLPSGKAELWRLADGEEICVPASVAHQSPDGFLQLPEWFARKKGLG